MRTDWRLNRILRAIRADVFESVCRMDRALSLETSSCRRTLTASGSLTEVVRLDGICGGLTDAELEKFVQRFPVERI